MHGSILNHGAFGLATAVAESPMSLIENAPRPSAQPALDEAERPSRFRLLKIIGPGVVTGASDDDPSGIGTYSQAGAQLGFSISWTMVLTFPLMLAIQEI